MALNAIVLILFIGGLSGWLAGLLISGYGFGLLGNVAVGIAGAFVASWLFPMLGLAGGGGGILASVLHATIGAVLLLALIRLIKRI